MPINIQHPKAQGGQGLAVHSEQKKRRFSNVKITSLQKSTIKQIEKKLGWKNFLNQHKCDGVFFQKFVVNPETPALRQALKKIFFLKI